MDTDSGSSTCCRLRWSQLHLVGLSCKWAWGRTSVVFLPCKQSSRRSISLAAVNIVSVPALPCPALPCPALPDSAIPRSALHCPTLPCPYLCVSLQQIAAEHARSNACSLQQYFHLTHDNPLSCNVCCCMIFGCCLCASFACAVLAEGDHTIQGSVFI